MSERKKMVIFTLKVHSIVCEITNSSSELFVGKNQSKEIMESMIKELYPNYLDEYDELLNIDELSPDTLDTYFEYACSSHCWPATKEMYPVLPGFTFEELYEPEDDGKVAWNGSIQYRLKNNVNNPKYKWHRAFVTEENFEEIKNKLDPKREMYFLYSKDENPDWEYQEKLEMVMERHHLG